ncbi:MAG: metallophosphoesterase family protein [Reyranellales bacterium]
MRATRKASTPAGGHSFGRPRPGALGSYVLHQDAQRNVSFRPLPPPTGKAPFRLDLKSIIPKEDYAAIVKNKKLTFHLNGDMGGIKYGVPQELVASGMEADFDPKRPASDNPAFLYITGDCVYFNGEIDQYYSQFYEPYQHYPKPIFAVPGNHDGENLATGNSLDGFVRNFCAPKPVKQKESGESNRTAMTQPNVYWTLLTPFVNIVGLYSNVPEGGEIKSPQTEWLINELNTLPKDIPIFVALHHPIYSADTFHSGSTRMKQLLETAAEKSGRHPEMVLAGHVHDFQRLTKNMPDGAQVPYIVAGNGGYHNLHSIQKVNGAKMVAPVVFNDKGSDPVTLERYSDDHWGFVRLEVTNKLVTGRFYEVPRPQEPYSKANQLVDYFEFDWKSRKYVPNTLSKKPA